MEDDARGFLTAQLLLLPSTASNIAGPSPTPRPLRQRLRSRAAAPAGVCAIKWQGKSWSPTRFDPGRHEPMGGEACAL
ncbi:hypothetical protein B0H19DRAFT_1203398, partial [Mycena capillaripes]